MRYESVRFSTPPLLAAAVTQPSTAAAGAAVGTTATNTAAAAAAAAAFAAAAGESAPATMFFASDQPRNATDVMLNEGAHSVPFLRARGMDEPRHMYLFVERDQLQAKRNALPGRCGLRIYSPRAATLGPVLHPSLRAMPLVLIYLV